MTEAINLINDDESMEIIAEVLQKSQPGYYIIFEMCDDTSHEVRSNI